MRQSNGYLQFEVLFIPQKEGGFTVEVPDLPGCISEGDTLEEAEKNIKEAIELYLETLDARGMPLPQRTPENILRMEINILRPHSRKAIYA